MSLRVDIDPQDIANLERDTRKRVTRASLGLAFTATLLTAALIAAGVTGWRAFVAIAQSGDAPLTARLATLARDPSPDFIALVVCAATVLLAVAAAAGVYKARRARARNRKQERLKTGLTIGRFDYQFTEACLIVRSPIALKKIAWSAIDRIENAKSNLIFRKYDGGFEFIPKNAIKQEGLLEILQKNHGAAIKSNLSFDEAVHAKPLSVSFECTPSDLAEYRARYHREREGWLGLLRPAAQWRLWPAYLFLAFVAIGAGYLYVAFRTFDLASAALGFGFFTAAAITFATNAQLFRGPAHPFRKDRKWPYGQSEMTAVTLSKNGLFISRNGVTEVIDWQGVQGFLECRLTSYLVIMPAYAVPVPKRVFLNAEHYRTFSSFAKARLSEASRARAEQKQQRLMSSLGSKPQQAKPNGAAAAKPEAQPKQAAQATPNRQPQKAPPPPQQAAPKKPKPAVKGAPPQVTDAQPISTRAQLQRKPAPSTRPRPQAAAR